MAVVPVVELQDPISPSSVEHCVDAGVDEQTRELLFHCNYLRYRFDVHDGTIAARSYLDEIEKVSLQLPKGMSLAHPDAERVLEYLKRRYRRVEMLHQEGYVSVWPAAASS